MYLFVKFIIVKPKNITTFANSKQNTMFE